METTIVYSWQLMGEGFKVESLGILRVSKDPKCAKYPLTWVFEP